MAQAIVSHTKFDVKEISTGLDEGFLDATALAEYLVGKGAAFREAHGIVGALVADCEKQKRRFSQLSLDDLKRRSSLIEKDVYEYLGAANVVDKYVTEGAAGTKQAKRQVAFWNKRLAQR
jgi:argininosuccinate lyase